MLDNLTLADGHHKLIRWNMVTHAGIDGFSRIIVFMKCSDNNKASTVYSYFLRGVRHYGLPSRVRSDQGRENCLVAQHMLEYRGSDRRSIIVGSSIHNQRIERLWRDMHHCATKVFYRLFYYLEDLGLLDRNDDIHIYALHYVYIPRVNKSLSTFKEGWNNHGIRTEHGLSPCQLFVAGALQLRQSGQVALDFFETVDDGYGIDEELLVHDESSEVIVPEGRFSLTTDHLHQLQQQVDPLEESENLGIELYERALAFIQYVVSQNPLVYGT